MDHGPAEKLAGNVAESATRLLKAFRAELALDKRAGDFNRDEFVRTRRVTQECAEAYLNAMREYVAFFETVSVE